MANFSTVSLCIILALANHAMVEVLSQNVCMDHKCVPNAVCKPENNEPTCECMSGYSGKPGGIGCHKKCNDFSDCPDDQGCYEMDVGGMGCFDVCDDYSCGPNAVCVGKGQQPKCECRPGYTGDPDDEETGCQEESKDKCQSDDDCASDQSCQATDQGIKDCNAVCMDNSCGANANCVGADHKASCQCNSGFTGDAKTGCKEESHDRCQSDDDCASDQSCQTNDQGINDCADVCMETACGANANCVGEDHQASCQCNSGFTGDANAGCTEESHDKCQSDDDCGSDQSCQATDQGMKDCAAVCEDNSCGANAECVGADHQASCQCNAGFTGDANTGCEEESQDRCQSDNDCAGDQSCQATDQGTKDCSAVCTATSCGPNANCMGAGHMASCQCNSGFTGDASDVNTGCQDNTGGGGSTGCANTLDSALQKALRSNRFQSYGIPTMNVNLGSSRATLSMVRVFNIKNLRRTGTCTMSKLGSYSMDKTTIGAANIFFTGYLSNYGLSGILLPSSKVFFRIDIQSFNSGVTIKTPTDPSSVPTLLGYQTLLLRGIRVTVQGGPALLKKVLNLLMGVSQILYPTYFNGVINSVLNAMFAKLVQNLSL